MSSKSKRKSKQASDENVNNSLDVQDMLQQLAAGMVQLTTTVNILVQSIDNKEGKSHAASQAAAKEGHVAILSDKSYITSWKELGGTNIAFTPGGKMHPMAFLRRIEKIFQEAGVPEQRKIGLAITCLRGSATDWASIKEKSFTSYGIFREMFINRFWGVDKQRDLFLHLNYGKFESGSRAEYFLNLVNQASFLSESIPEEKLIKMLAKHFSPDIQRGMMILGLNEFDAVDDYLHNLDESYTEEEHVPRDNRRNLRCRDREVDRAVGRPNPNPNAYRETRNDTPNWRGEDAVRNYDNNLRNITKFNEDNDLMSESSDIEEGQECEKFETPAILLEVGGEPLPALLDSGSEVTGISEKLYNKLVGTLKFPILPVTKVSISVATGNLKQHIKKQVLLPIVLSDIGKQIDIRCLVVPGLNCDILLGCDFLQKHNVVVDFKRSAASITIEEDKHLINFVSCNEVDTHINICKTVALVIKPKVDEKHRYLDSDFSTKAEEAQADTEVKDQLRNLLEEHNDIFSECPGMAKSYVHRIEMDDVTPFNVPNYPVPLVYRDQVHDQIREMLEWGIIAREKTAYISPLVVVKKRDGSPRICLDARALNKKMKKDFVKPPNPSELLLGFKSGGVLSSIDLTFSYWQIPIHEDDRKYVGFVYNGESYVFKRLPSGLSTSMASLIRYLTQVFRDKTDFILVYVDDILVFSANIELHWKHLRQIFQIFAEEGLTIKLRKCQFIKHQVEFLGHIISKDGILMNPKRTSAILNFPTPRNVRELRAFLGLVNYESRFVDNYSELTVPLLYLLRKNQRWAWGEHEERAFTHVKEAYTNVSIVSHPDFTKDFYIQCDASKYAVRGCLFQESSSSGRNVLAYTSCTLKGAQLRYTTTEKEMWALGRPLKVLIDHKAEQRAAKFNAKINPVSFKEGDKVLIRVHAQSSAEDRLIRKLFLLYEGPYIVQRQAGPNSYVLVDDQGRELPKQNVINLKAYKELPEEC
nr:unnamed protein product [Callosobruchus chinensis]